MKNYDVQNYETNEVKNEGGRNNIKNNRKYISSLLYTLKDLLLLILKSGIIGALILNILMYAVFKEPFDAIGCLAYIICGGCIGIVIGYVIKSLHGQGDIFTNATGTTMYNMYAGVYNLRVLSGSTIGSGMSIIGLFLTIIVYAFIVIYSLLLIPVSLVYLVIMSIIEAIVHGIPQTLGCILDKLIMIASGIGSIALVIRLIAQI